MAAWENAPVVDSRQPSWASAPVVNATAPTETESVDTDAPVRALIGNDRGTTSFGRKKPALPPQRNTDVFSGLPQPIIDDIISKTSSNRNVRGAGALTSVRRRLANLERIRLVNPALATEIESIPGYEQFLIGAGKGFEDIGQGIGRLVGLLDAEDVRDSPEYNALKSTSNTVTAGELAGQSAPFLPLGLGAGSVSNLAGRAALMSGTGALEGGIITAGQGGTPEEIAASAVLGGSLAGGSELALPVFSRVSRGIVKKLTGRVPEGSLLQPNGRPTPEFQKVLDDNGLDVGDVESIAREYPDAFVDDIEGNARRQAAFEKLGITPTEAQRTRSATLFREQQDLVREGDTAVRAAIEAQDDALSRAVQSTSEAARAGAGTADNIIDVVTDRSLRLDDEISSAYRAAREASPDVRNVRFDNAAQRLRSLAPRNERSQGTVNAIFQEMQARGLVDKNFKPIGRISVQQAEDLRQFANTLVPGANPQAREIIRQFKDALDEDVIRVAGEDVFANARAAKRSFEESFRKAKVSKFDQNQVSLVRDILENRIAPEELFEKAVRAKSRYKASDLQSLRDYLFSGTEGDVEAGLRAWNNLRGDALIHIKDTAFIGPVTQTGNQSLSRAGLDRAFKSIGDAKLKVLFSDNEIKFLRDLAAVASLKEPPPGTFTGSGPSGPAIRQLENSLNRLYGKIPLIGDFITGTVDSIKTKAARERVLKLVNDAQKIEEAQAREAFNALRKSRIGDAASAIPLLAAPAAADDE